jgi:hypothetical protein
MYMLVAIEDVVDEAVYYGRFPYCLVSQEDYFVFEQRRNGPLRQI